MNTLLSLRALLAVALFSSVAGNAATPDAVKTALSSAVKFYHDKAASHGGYVYRYSADSVSYTHLTLPTNREV